jgi:putative OPT family oligopeptide transporter
MSGGDEALAVPRTEQGIAGRALMSLMAFCLVLSGFVYYVMTGSGKTTLLITGIMFVLAFFFVAVASYIVGLVGSSNSPVSGMTICTVLITSGLLLMLGYTGEEGMLAALGVAGVVCCAACTSGDICQALKIGHIVGATPRRLQIGELFGTMIPAFIIAPTLMLLHNAYGIGEAASQDVEALPAPQAAMFEKLVGGIFGRGEAIPWDLVGYGAVVGVIAIAIDLAFLQPRDTKFRLHAMPLAVGMYLPLTVTFPILLGGAAFLIVDRGCRARGLNGEDRQACIHKGLLFASGLVAGEAIMMIVIAVLLVTNAGIPFFESFADSGDGLWITAASAAGLLFMLFLMIRKTRT